LRGCRAFAAVRNGRVTGRTAELAAGAVAIDRGAGGESHAAIILFDGLPWILPIVLMIGSDWGWGLVAKTKRRRASFEQLYFAVSMILPERRGLGQAAMI
jgi:hypothetical protein